MKERLVQKLFKKATSAALVASMVVTMVQPTIAMAAELDEEEVVVETEVAADMDVAEEGDVEGEAAFAYDGDVDLTNSIEIDNAEATYQYTDIGPTSFSNRVIRTDKYGDRVYFTNKTGGSIKWRHQYVEGTYRNPDKTISNNSQTYVWNNLTYDPACYVFFTYNADTRTVYTVCVRVSQWKFKDVWPNQKDWKYDAIKYMVDNKIMKGVNEENFQPEKSITRGEMAQMIYNMEGSPSVNTKQVFKDVPAGKWCAPAITWCSQKGIIKGYTDGTFRPDTNVTREMIAQMIKGYAAYRGQNVNAGNNLGGFADANQVDGWARDAMNWAIQKGVISGAYVNGQKHLQPRKDATRAETAAMVKKFKTAK